MSKTIDNVVKTASKLGLAGLLAMSSGCLGSAIITGYGAQCNQPGAYAFGNALNQTEAAREGKTTVIVPQGNGQGSNIPDMPTRGETTLKFGDGRIYVGEVRKIKDNEYCPLGKGVLTERDGTKWEGYFVLGNWAGTTYEDFVKKKKEMGVE